MDRCRYCDAPDLSSVLCTEGPHYAKLICTACGRQVGYLPKPMDFARAAAFTLPFGKYAQRTLEDVGSTAEGRRYLVWLASQEGLAGSIKRALDCYLAGPAAESA